MALKEATKNCIELLKYRVFYQLREVEETEGNMKIWRLVLRGHEKGNSLNTTNDDVILCSGCGDIPQDVCKKKNDIYDRFSNDLVLVKLQQETNDIYYVLPDCGKKDEVTKATSVKELEGYSKILYISHCQEPPEPISSEILKSCFDNSKQSCSNLDKRFIQMMRNGDVQQLMQEIPDVAEIKYAVDENGWTFLHHAVHHGNLDILPFLTSKGCDGHAKDNICGRKPVIIAAREGHTDIVEFFLLQGLSVNEADNIGWTLLHYAAWKGNLKAVRFLIQKKAQLDLKDKCSGKTPLLVAVEGGHLEVVQLLVESGSSIEEKTIEKKTPLHFAAYRSLLDVVKFLVDQGADLNFGNKDGWTPLHYAAWVGHLETAKFLVDRGANLNVGDKDGWTPLHDAAREGHMEVVEFLVDRGADLNVATKYRWTPLHHAANNGHLNIVEFLAGRGADLNVGNKNGRTPLHHAVSKGHLKIVEMLVDRGACLDIRDKDDCTPLHHASNKEYLNIVEFLAGRGADLNALNNKGETPLVSGVQHINVASYLASKMLFILQNQNKSADSVKFYKELLEIQKNNSEFVDPETLTNQRKIGEILLLMTDNEVQRIFNNIFVVQKAFFSTKLSSATQQTDYLFPEQIKAVKIVNDENLNENEASFGNKKTISFTQTEEEESLVNKISLFFIRGKSIHVWMIIIWSSFLSLCYFLLSKIISTFSSYV